MDSLPSSFHRALFTSQEAPEDDRETGKNDLIKVTCSGVYERKSPLRTTPYVQ